MNAKSFVKKYFNDGDSLPFSFVYGGRPFGEIAADWRFERSKSSAWRDDKRTFSLTLTDPAGDLSVRCDAVEYRDYPAIEWTLHFIAHAETEIISEIRDLDICVQAAPNAEFHLNRILGCRIEKMDYAPLREPLPPNSTKRLTAFGGRATSHDMPYFNISYGHEGMFAVIGWPGQWSAEFARGVSGACDTADGLAVRCGLELTHYRLHAGEQTRGPLILVMFYKGDLAESQNLWRRFHIAYNSPRHADGSLPHPQVCGCTSHIFNEMVNGTEENQIAYMNKYEERRIPLDVWHMDAGWYAKPPDGWARTGTWEIDYDRFPRGFRPITDLARSKGMTNIVWFECERVTMYTWLMKERPQWLVSVKPNDRTRVLDLGNPEALDWLIHHVDEFLTREGVETYRQDFNHYPLDAWRANDAEDRQGLTEIKHLTGYFKFWDALVERHPGMVIDGNSSGGKRDDLESMRRSINLTRSDYLMEPEGLQNQSLGLPQWIPYSGTGLIAGKSVLPLLSCPPGTFFPLDAYTFRSMMAPSMTSCFDVMDDGLDYAFIRKMLREYRRLAQFYYADFYPLTPPSDNSSVWIAWQFHEAESGKGVVQIFKRAQSPYLTASFKLRGLELKCRYRFRFSNSRMPDAVLTGAEAMRSGLPVALRKCPDSAVAFYEKIISAGE